MLDRAYGMSDAALDNGQVNSSGSFVDVPSSAYYSKAVIAAKAFGIVAGTATGAFQPQQPITRQDAMVFLKRTIDRTALKLGTGSVSSFSDASRISNYAKPFSVSALVGAKVIGGSKGKINPLSKVTRAEMAVMLYRATHLTVQGSGAVYQSRGDLVNLCIGTQNYCDVVIENYDPLGDVYRSDGVYGFPTSRRRYLRFAERQTRDRPHGNVHERRVHLRRR